MEYIWMQVEGFEGLYDLRNDGLLYSHTRATTKGGYTYGNKRGRYYQFHLCKKGFEKYINANRLVYETFVGHIPEGYDVHHINHNSKDNRVENLELIELHKHRGEHNKKRSKPVLQYSIDGTLIKEWISVTEASNELKISNVLIGKCCNKKPKHKTAGGFIWKWKEVA